jgi:hypothetical protein
MDNLVKGQKYYVKQYSTTFDKVVYYDEYRAKFIGEQQGINKFMTYNNINYYKTNYRPTYLSVVPVDKIIKMESLKDITNEMLPSEILNKIDSYI